MSENNKATKRIERGQYYVNISNFYYDNVSLQN